MRNLIKISQKAWNSFLKPAVNVTAPFIGMPVEAKTKNPKAAQATTKFSKSISGIKFLNPTDMYGSGLHLKVIRR